MSSEEKPVKNEKTQENIEKVELTLEQRKKQFLEELTVLKKQYNLNFEPKMDFFEFRVLPDEVKLAILVLSKFKMRYILELVEERLDDN